MAVVSNQVSLNFVDKKLRPLAELFRALEARVADAENEWNNIGGSNAHTGSDTVENRSAEGIQSVTWTEVTNVVAALMAARDVITESAGRAGLIEKVTVRSLEVSI